MNSLPTEKEHFAGQWCPPEYRKQNMDSPSSKACATSNRSFAAHPRSRHGYPFESQRRNGSILFIIPEFAQEFSQCELYKAMSATAALQARTAAVDRAANAPAPLPEESGESASPARSDDGVKVAEVEESGAAAAVDATGATDTTGTNVVVAGATAATGTSAAATGASAATGAVAGAMVSAEGPSAVAAVTVAFAATGTLVFTTGTLVFTTGTLVFTTAGGGIAAAVVVPAAQWPYRDNQLPPWSECTGLQRPLDPSASGGKRWQHGASMSIPLLGFQDVQAAKT